MKEIMNKKALFFVVLILAFVSINAQTYPWSVNDGLYQDSRSFIGQVSIDGITQTASYIEVAAIVGNGNAATVRAVERIREVQNVACLKFNIQFTNAGEPVRFKVCVHGDNDEPLEILDYYKATSQGSSIDIVTGTTYGTPFNPIHLDFSHKYDLPISQYTNTTTSSGWYLIASPLAATVSPTAVENMISSTEANYDLYFFDQAGTGNGKEWKNWKEDANGGSTNHGFNLVPGTGYLYANSEDVTLTFIGAPNEDNEVTLTRGTNTNHQELEGWNLIGNSFTTAKTIGGRGYYRMNPDGRSELIAGTGNIDAMEGIFVYYDPEDANAANREETVTFTNPNSKRAEGDDMVLLTLNRNNGGTIDRVIVRFDEGGTLPKYTLRDNSTIIYIPQADRDYAVVKGSATNVFPVNFKTEDFGTYTISSDIASANVDYMHLIDKITGEDIDMLLEGEYSFVAAPVDRQDRFILRLNYSGYFDDNDVNNFAYQNGSEIVVCGEGTLQVFDVMGRFVSSYEINGVQTIHALPMGVYIFRMVGDDIRTQKIYVR